MLQCSSLFDFSFPAFISVVLNIAILVFYKYETSPQSGLETGCQNRKAFKVLEQSCTMLLLLVLALYVLPQWISLQESARYPADEASLNQMLICWWVESFLVQSFLTPDKTLPCVTHRKTQCTEWTICITLPTSPAFLPRCICRSSQIISIYKSNVQNEQRKAILCIVSY